MLHRRSRNDQIPFQHQLLHPTLKAIPGVSVFDGQFTRELILRIDGAGQINALDIDPIDSDQVGPIPGEPRTGVARRLAFRFVNISVGIRHQHRVHE
ncbi:MAG: hypothetical protein ACJAZO_001863 [Myxococcota bacterium]|jgi:hypothetical protein